MVKRGGAACQPVGLTRAAAHRRAPDGYATTTTRHYTWDVPHDTDGFIEMWPSPEAFVEKLEFSMQQSTQVRHSLAS